MKTEMETENTDSLQEIVFGPIHPPQHPAMVEHRSAASSLTFSFAPVIIQAIDGCSCYNKTMFYNQLLP